MPAAGTRSDALRLEISGNELAFMRSVGALSGVVVLAVAALNGPGSGRLICNGGQLQWKAPGSDEAGTAVNVSAGGTFLLEDGEDATKWIRVEVYEEYLPTAGEAVVLIQDAYNDFADGDIEAADALAGVVVTQQYTIHNVSADAAENVRLWINPAASGAEFLEVSDDGLAFVAPDDEEHADVLVWASIAGGATESVWVRRTIPAAQAHAIDVLTHLELSWISIPTL